MHPETYQGPGLYRHYKGGLYLVRGLDVTAAQEALAPGGQAPRGVKRVNRWEGK